MAEEIRAQLERVNASLGGEYKLDFVDLTALRPARKNARRMNAAMMSRLEENIARDGQLASLPLCWKRGDSYEILSGHHRIQAAINAGVTTGLILYTDSDMSDERRTAIQLSHNSLSGADDVQILLSLVADIGSPEELEYAGADLLGIESEALPTLLGMSEARLVLRPVTFMLTDAEMQTLDELTQEIDSSLARTVDGAIYQVDLPVWQAFMEGLGQLAEKYKIKSANAALCHAIALIRFDMDQSADE